MATASTPANILTRRIVERLQLTHDPVAGSNEPTWTIATVQRVLAAAGDVVVEAIANGEAVQLGRLGKFYPRVVDERTVVSNLGPTPEKVPLPKRIRIEFDPTPYAEQKAKELFSLVEELTRVAKASSFGG